MGKKLTRMLAAGLCVALTAGATSTLLAGCFGKKITNEGTPLNLASGILDGVFNPFFYTSGDDGEVVGQTQIGMLTSDENGEIVAGWDEACASLAYSVVTTGSKDNMSGPNDYSNFYTDYYFALKDNVKFSDGVPLTMDDVLFNIYMYLDRAYTGSSTMYSVDIQGLKAYRAQSEDENEIDNTDTYFNTLVEARMNAIYDWAQNDQTNDWDNFAAYEVNPATPHIKDDILKAHDYFKEELESDWTSAIDTVKDYEKYVDKNGNKLITEGWQVFLYQYNIFKITVDPTAPQNNKYYKAENDYDGNKDKDSILAYVYAYMLGDYATAPKSYKDNLVNVTSYYGTASTLRSYILASVIKEELAGEMVVKTVKGITPIGKQSTIPGENGTTIQLKDANGNNAEYEVLKIRINGVDPKAIQNFSFTVAPGHYYSTYKPAGETKTTWEKALEDPEYFGVEFADADFMDYVKKIQVPLGAGPYRASKLNGSKCTDIIDKSDFESNNVVYMERNDYFLLGAPKIRMLRFQVMSQTMLYDSVKTGTVHYATPNADSDTINNKLLGEDKDNLTYALADNLGYGYIGISAQAINNINIRRAIMSTLDPSLCVSYYGGSEFASVIYRPMSKTLTKYYPTGATAYYEYDSTGAAALDYAVEQGGCTMGSDGYLYYNGNKLKYTFTIAGDSDDHPANSMILNSAKILNDIGFEITVTHDSTALSKLANGQLTVWAAAWSSSSDPDMYQVYHKLSTATSIKAWGYSYLTSSQCDAYQRGLVDTLSDLIEEGRETTVVSERKAVYDEALDKLMELAVEFPTYQRKVLYVWPQGLFDESTMYTGNQVKTYRSPLSDIWNVSFKEG